jgi:hypothetical protein
MLTAVAMLAVRHVGDGSSRAASGSPTPRVSTAASTQSASPSSVAPIQSSVIVTQLGRRLLAAPDNWELFGRGPEGVVRIELASGKITRTVLPALGTSGEVSFVVGPRQVILRPSDRVPGYLVPDGRPPQVLPEPFADAFAVYPGPDPMHVWVQMDAPSLELVRVDGSATGTSIPYPIGDGVVSSDGGGGLLFTGLGGVYRMQPDGLRRVTIGTVLAVGPTRWLAEECDDVHRCVTVVIDRATGARRVITTPTTTAYETGVVSPDGRTAAIWRFAQSEVPALRLIDLATGADHGVPVSPPQGGDGTLLWSPDSRTLLGVDSDFHVFAVDRATERITRLGNVLPQLVQLAGRTTGR